MERELPNVFLAQHRQIHAATEAGALNLEDRAVAGLSDWQMRRCSPEHNSTVWLLWHLARNEDLMVNTILLHAPEVFDLGHWQERLGVTRRDVGVGWSIEEVAALSASIDLPALRAYRAAVGETTRTRLTAADFDDFDALVAGAGDRARASGDIAAGQDWAYELVDSMPRRWFLCFEVIGHSYLHLGEALHVAWLLKREKVLEHERR